MCRIRKVSVCIVKRSFVNRDYAGTLYTESSSSNSIGLTAGSRQKCWCKGMIISVIAEYHLLRIPYVYSMEYK